MSDRMPRTELGSHSVRNQPRPLGDYDAAATDLPLREAVAREGGAWVDERVAVLGREVGRGYWFEQGELANQNPPLLRAFDAYGSRLDEVRYHPAYHQLLRLALEHGTHTVAWQHRGEGGHVAHVAELYLLTQPEQGYCCPLVMTHAAVPALRADADVADEWLPRLLVNAYDPRSRPASEKQAAMFGMAMTEKQGGTDVRANTTEAREGADGWRLNGHKWFCSAPMSDAFLTLAQTGEGLTCFLVPRWCPSGERNTLLIQRLKDKCGNRSNASAEIVYHDTWAQRLGAPGRGVQTIIAMVQQTRLDAATAPVGMMRQALVRALHHVSERRVLGRRLAEQPLMRAVLTDLALDVEAGTALVLRLARAYDRASTDPAEAALARLTTPAAKYWTNKRAPAALSEAMECLGGNGYVEEHGLARLYREAPVNSIWEGAGNVMCLDVLRVVSREPECIEALTRELAAARGGDARLDAAISDLRGELASGATAEHRARWLTERLAVVLAAALLVRHAPAAVADAFCGARLGPERGATYGTLPEHADNDGVLARAWPSIEGVDKT